VVLSGALDLGAILAEVLALGSSRLLRSVTVADARAYGGALSHSVRLLAPKRSGCLRMAMFIRGTNAMAPALRHGCPGVATGSLQTPASAPRSYEFLHSRPYLLTLLGIAASGVAPWGSSAYAGHGHVALSYACRQRCELQVYAGKHNFFCSRLTS
jgi:hypothetical protein